MLHVLSKIKLWIDFMLQGRADVRGSVSGMSRQFPDFGNVLCRASQVGGSLLKSNIKIDYAGYDAEQRVYAAVVDDFRAFGDRAG